MRYEKNVILKKEYEGNKIVIEFKIKALSDEKGSFVIASARPVSIRIE